MDKFDRAVIKVLEHSGNFEPNTFDGICTMEDKLAVDLIGHLTDVHDPDFIGAVTMVIEVLHRHNLDAITAFRTFYDGLKTNIFNVAKVNDADAMAVHIAGAVEWPELYDGKDVDDIEE